MWLKKVGHKVIKEVKMQTFDPSYTKTEYINDLPSKMNANNFVTVKNDIKCKSLSEKLKETIEYFLKPNDSNDLNNSNENKAFNENIEKVHSLYKIVFTEELTGIITCRQKSI